MEVLLEVGMQGPGGKMQVGESPAWAIKSAWKVTHLLVHKGDR